MLLYGDTQRQVSPIRWMRLKTEIYDKVVALSRLWMLLRCKKESSNDNKTDNLSVVTVSIGEIGGNGKNVEPYYSRQATLTKGRES